MHPLCQELLAATVMIGEKGVDMIINEYQTYNTKKKESKDEL